MAAFSVFMRKLDTRIVLTLVLATGTVMFYGLGRGSLADWDEAIYAQVAREIVNTKEWLSLQWGYSPWFHKPPLFMWLTALSFSIGGVTVVAARMVSAFSAVAVVLLTYFLGKKLGGRAQGILSALVLLTTQHFVGAGRFGTTDVLLTLWIYLAVFSLVRVREGKPNAWYGVGVANGLAVMTKGAAGLVFAPVLLGMFMLDASLRRSLRSKELWGGVSLFALVVLPWHLFMTWRFGSSFWNEYLGYHVLARATQAIELHQGGPYYYLDMMRSYFYPWFFLVPGAFVLLVKEAVAKSGDRRYVSVLVLPAVIYLLYSLVRTKLGWYILPAYPALAICVGWLLRRAWLDKDLASRLALLLPIAIIAPVLPVPAAAMLSALALLGFMALKDNAGRRLEYVTYLVLGALFLIGAAKAFRQVFIYEQASTVATSRAAFRGGNTRNQPLYVAGPLTTPHIQFYSNRPVVRVDKPADIPESTEDVEVILSEETYRSDVAFQNYSVKSHQDGYYLLKRQ